MTELDSDSAYAMVCHGPGRLLRGERRPLPAPRPDEILVKVLACGVCRTDLHVVDGEIPASYPIVPGHEIVGKVLATGRDATGFALGQRVGIPWLGHTCGHCRYCKEGQENLCETPQFTGASRDGGYATHVVADARFCFALPEGLSDLEAAPLLCAGLIGWRAYRMAGPGRRIGLYGFGAAAHILAQLAVAEGRDVLAFTREGDVDAQQFARTLGCSWAGASTAQPEEPLDAAIIFAPVGALVPAALKAVRKGGRVVCAGIHMSDIPSFPYADLWGERHVLSVANLTREDGLTFLTPDIVGKLKSHAVPFPLADANRALAELREGRLQGVAVLVP